MTEQEMKQTWCPHARVPGYDYEGNYNGTSINRPENTAPWPKCIGRGCSQWRWTISPMQAESRPSKTEPSGYCGLAGKP
jgi:hypothetical protein